MDLVNLWLAEAYGTPHVYKNAVDWAAIALPGHAWVRNTPNNYPSIGCIVVWGPNAYWGIGANGHIGLCVAADVMHLLSFDQNYPEGSPAHMQLHDYRGVLGWHCPK